MIIATSAGEAITMRMCGGPAVLRSKTMYFTSWKYVRQGEFVYQRDGQQIDMWDVDGPTPAQHVPILMPRGVRLDVQPARKVPTGLALPMGILREGGRYRAWCMVEGAASPHIRPGHNLYTGYAESDDGFDWVCPPVGDDGTNILFRGDADGSTRGCQTPCVFHDPASTRHPYKMLYLGYVTDREVRRFAGQYLHEVDTMAVRPDLGHWYGLCGAVSSDGIAWSALDEPMAIHHADSQNTCYYDLDRECYVAYVRTWDVTRQAQAAETEGFYVSGRRAIGRMVSTDFRHFSAPEIIVSTRPDMSPCHVWYTNCKTTLPGCPDQHVMFPWRWEFENDGGDCWLLSSPDGLCWSQVPGPPAVARGAQGESDGAKIVALPPLFELPDGRWALYARGFAVPHTYPGQMVKTRTGLHPGVPNIDLYAVWPKGRLVALQADGDGEFATVALVPPADRLRINASVRPGGCIQVAVRFLGRPTWATGPVAGEVVRGRDFADCAGVTGDGLAVPVAWNGETHLNHDGRPIVLCFRMKRAALFGVEFY